VSYIGLIITFIFINNIVLMQCLGLCPLLSTSLKKESVLGLGCAAVSAITGSAVITYIIYNIFLVPLGLQFLHIMTFILVSAGFVRLWEAALKKISPVLHKMLSTHLFLMTANCAVAGITFIGVREKYNLLESFLAGLAAGLGMLLALVLFAAIRDKLERENVPRALRGTPIVFITAGLMAMAFTAFDMVFLKNIFR
jgi:electron transport complex protein RnfA